jgi:hypothetical protein
MRTEVIDTRILRQSELTGKPARAYYAMFIRRDRIMARLDTHVYSPEHVVHRLEIGDYFMQDVIERGRYHPCKTAPKILAGPAVLDLPAMYGKVFQRVLGAASHQV